MPNPIQYGGVISLNITGFDPTGSQFFPSIVGTVSGHIFAAWNTDNGHQLGFFRTDGATAPPLRKFSVSNGTLQAGNSQIDVAALADGRMIAAWSSNAVDAAGDINYQTFDLVAGAGALVPLAQVGAQTEAVIASTAALSQFTILYKGASATTFDVFRKSFNADGSVANSEGELSGGLNVTGVQEQPNIAGLSDGRQITVWADRNDGSIKGRFLSSIGSRTGATLTLSTTVPLSFST